MSVLGSISAIVIPAVGFEFRVRLAGVVALRFWTCRAGAGRLVVAGGGDRQEYEDSA